MSDISSDHDAPEADRALVRRVVWRMLAGWRQEEIRRAEGIGPEALQAILTGPRMFVLVNVWRYFFQEGDRGDLPLLTRLVRWCLDHIIGHARERAVGGGVCLAFVVSISFKLSFRSTLKRLCAHIEGVIGIADQQTPLRGVRGQLAEVMCWAIETALTQRLIDHVGEAEIIERDALYRRMFMECREAPIEEAEPAADEVAQEAPEIVASDGDGEPVLAYSAPVEMPADVLATEVMGRRKSPALSAASSVAEPVSSADSVSPDVTPPATAAVADELRIVVHRVWMGGSRPGTGPGFTALLDPDHCRLLQAPCPLRTGERPRPAERGPPVPAKVPIGRTRAPPALQ